MKRIVRSKSGREIYGPKWVEFNDNNSSESENGHDSLHSVAQVSDAAEAETNGVVDNQDQTQTHEVAHVSGAAVTETSVLGNQDLTSNGINRSGIRLSNSHQAMYKATVEDDRVAVELILAENRNFGSDEISEEGDRALHLAAAMKRQEIMQKLVEIMSPSEPEMLDGRGYTACCYAAISGSVKIADSMIRKNPTLATTRDRQNMTPLHKAALRGNTEMVSYFLKSTKIEHLSKVEWFDLLLVTIRRKMYDAALAILGSDEQLASMRNNEGTPLHLLARQETRQPFCLNRRQRINGEMRQDMRLLAKKLWADIQRLGEAGALEILKNPPLLDDAAKIGNVELITMIINTYPHLVQHTNTKGYTIFHVAVKYRHENLFGLIDEVGAGKDLIATTQDEDGNNILHLAARLGPPDNKILRMVAFRMQMEILWFEKVKAIVPPLCLEMRNKKGDTPRELFSKEHKRLLEESRVWIRNTADSCMLISTLIFTVVFSSAISVPGGFNQDTGIPILLNTSWFTVFFIIEALTMFSSVLSIICFLRIMILDVDEDHFVSHLPTWFSWGLNALTFSVFGAISTFISAYFLVYAKKKAAVVKSVIILVYIVMVFVVCYQYFFKFRLNLPESLFRKQNRYTLFKRTATARDNNKRSRCWIF